VSNALRYGFSRSLSGILGLAVGMLGVGALSSAGLGAALSSSATAFSFAKYLGAAYLIYLGVARLLAKRSPTLAPDGAIGLSSTRKFSEGASVTLLNPKAYFLFAALFPQFVDPTRDYVNRLFVGLAIGVAASTR
jgi:threonine/homoserine/homoserine lactone efflux protein